MNKEEKQKQVSEVAHKLRTPLTVMMSTVNNFLDGVYGRLNDEQTRWLKKLELHTGMLEKLSDEVLELLRHDEMFLLKSDNHLNKSQVSESFVSHVHPVHPKMSGDEKQPVILVVDDEPDILDVVREGLGGMGCVVKTASTGDSAISLAAELNPDLILMDVHLKDSNGLDLCKKIKSSAKSFIPIVMVTGQDDLTEKMSGSDHSADDLLSKPFQMPELFIRVKAMLRMKKLYDELHQLKG